jgi:membrane protease subunit (stomatin/prohibitin family)
MREALSGNALICAECGRLDPCDEPGWTLRLDVDDEPVAFCPECDRKEFGDA